MTPSSKNPKAITKEPGIVILYWWILNLLISVQDLMKSP